MYKVMNDLKIVISFSTFVTPPSPPPKYYQAEQGDNKAEQGTKTICASRDPFKMFIPRLLFWLILALVSKL